LSLHILSFAVPAVEWPFVRKIGESISDIKRV
jgi:hypothetical protein